MAGGHSSRAHALLSPSAAHRWLTCTPSAVLEDNFPNTDSEAAAEGTLAHELCEGKLLRKFHPNGEFTDRRFQNLVKKCRANELWQDEMDGYTDIWVETLFHESIRYDAEPYVYAETKLDLTAYIPDGFGTADCIMIGRVQGEWTIQVCDFKYGMNVAVSPVRNEQMMSYALGAYEKYKMLFPITRARLTIVQPRNRSEQGSFDISIAEVLEWGEAVLKPRAAQAFKGLGDFVPEDAACNFCRAKILCRARAEKFIELLKETGKMPQLLTPSEVGLFLIQGAGVENWIKSLKEYALSECLAGRDIPGWKAVEGRTNRSFSDGWKAVDALEKAGIKREDLYTMEPLSVAAMEKAAGKQFKAVEDLVVLSSGAPTLAKASAKKRAVTNASLTAEAERAALEEAFGCSQAS